MSDGADFKDIQRRMDGAISAYKNDLASLRTGRASANLLDPVQVEAYGFWRHPWRLGQTQSSPAQHAPNFPPKHVAPSTALFSFHLRWKLAENRAKLLCFPEGELPLDRAHRSIHSLDRVFGPWRAPLRHPPRAFVEDEPKGVPSEVVRQVGSFRKRQCMPAESNQVPHLL